MKISLEKVGKRYQEHWIFKDVNLSLIAGNRYALLGANGSGKSTLLRLVAGMQQHNRGQISYEKKGLAIPAEKIYLQTSYCAPGMDLIEEMTLQESLKFHFSFKKPLPGWSAERIVESMGMGAHASKYIHEFSSGMKQRVKLAQAIFSDAPILLLDEPCSNLDAEGVALYHSWLHEFTRQKLVVIASNDEREYPGAAQTFSMRDFNGQSL